jgi:hypothetical protein
MPTWYFVAFHYQEVINVHRANCSCLPPIYRKPGEIRDGNCVYVPQKTARNLTQKVEMLATIRAGLDYQEVMDVRRVSVALSTQLIESKGFSRAKARPRLIYVTIKILPNNVHVRLLPNGLWIDALYRERRLIYSIKLLKYY